MRARARRFLAPVAVVGFLALAACAEGVVPGSDGGHHASADVLAVDGTGTEAGHDAGDGGRDGGGDGGSGATCAPPCPTGETCVAGACRSSSGCDATHTACGGTCVDLSVNPLNCGACAHACASDQTCTAGACTGGCAAPMTRCATSCVDTQTDAANCGSCGRACATGATCTAGACCSMSTMTRTTGTVSGSGTVCCAPGETLVPGSVVDCGDGLNHSATMSSATCARASEGFGNGGNACAQITCAHSTCM